jgi:mono/diheme cytochrome c family protein
MSRHLWLIPTSVLGTALVLNACTRASQQGAEVVPSPTPPEVMGPVTGPITGPIDYNTQDTAAWDFSPKPPVVARSVEDEQRSFVLQPGYRMDPVLVEPIIREPMQIAFDGNGRLLVLEMRTYMQDADATGELRPVSRISMHDDTDGDGLYDHHTVFVDSLIVPRFVTPYGPNSVLTMESNHDEIWLYTDDDRDGKADRRELFTRHFGRTANIEHQPASLIWAMDNWLYSTYNGYRIRWSPEGVTRESTANPGGSWGVTQDSYGKTYVQEGYTGLPGYFQFPIRYGDFRWNEQLQAGLEVPYGIAGVADYQPGAGASRPDGTLNRVTGSAGNDVVRGHRMPDDLLGDYIYGEPVARIVRRVRLVDMEGLQQFQNVYQDRQEEFIRSTDHLFRPVQQQTAPDGTLYIVDAYRGIIQQGNWTQEGSYLRRKIEQYRMENIYGNGRIWRLSHESLPRDTRRPRMNDETPGELVAHLEHPNGWWRDTAQRLLVIHQDRSVVPALEAMARSSTNLFARFHALWTLEGLTALSADLVRELMADPDADMRIQAIRASESLYKGGNRSFVADYQRLLRDADTDVVIQSLLTLNYFQVPDLENIAHSTMQSRSERGIQFVADRIVTRLQNPPSPALGGLTPAQQDLMRLGMTAYSQLCASCHGPSGSGIQIGGTMVGPPLAGSEGVLGHRDHVIKALIYGMQGPEGRMPAMGQNPDEWVAAVGSYIRNSFSNRAPHIRPEEVAAVRAANAGRDDPFTYAQLVATVPVLLEPQENWRVTASHSALTAVGATADPAGAFTFEGWTTGRPQESGMWFQIDLGGPTMLTEIEFTSPTQGGGPGNPPLRAAPLGYNVETSLNGTTWTSVAKGGSDGTAATTIPFEPTQTRYVRITQTGTAENAPVWTIHRLKLFAPPTGAQ